MADATVRVSGTVLNIDVRTGNARATGEPYRINEARVLVEETGIAEVTVPDSMSRYGRGEVVDLLCDVSVYNGRAQLRAVRDLLAA